jgi:putative aminopeptidase FrvX
MPLIGTQAEARRITMQIKVESTTGSSAGLAFAAELGVETAVVLYPTNY